MSATSPWCSRPGPSTGRRQAIRLRRVRLAPARPRRHLDLRDPRTVADHGHRRPGRGVAAGSSRWAEPMVLYRRAANTFVASFLTQCPDHRRAAHAACPGSAPPVGGHQAAACCQVSVVTMPPFLARASQTPGDVAWLAPVWLTNVSRRDLNSYRADVHVRHCQRSGTQQSRRSPLDQLCPRGDLNPHALYGH